MMSPRRLLVIGPDTSAPELDLCSLFAELEDVHIERILWADLSYDRLGASGAHVVLALAPRNCATIHQFLLHLRDRPLPMPTLAIFPRETEIEVIRAAADVVDDFIIAPVQACVAGIRLCKMLGPPSEIDSLQARLSSEFGLAQIAGQNEIFLRTIAKIPRIAASNATVLITGETGVGKELCARAIHHLSSRAAHPFIPMDCGALPENLMENEMFGHARGAYTGAHVDQKGLVALAEGGTLFLDEVDSLSLAAQAKLLRLLQEHTYRALGAERFCRSDARIIAATNGILDSLLKTGKFRQDLYYRLDILHLHIPPLRERKSDIAPLAQHVLDAFGKETNGPRKRLSPAALRKLEFHDWPGNVRELFNVVQRAAILSSNSEIGPRDIVHCANELESSEHEPPVSFRNARAVAIQTFERTYVAALLRKHHGNITHAAIEAGKDRRAFGRLVGKYQIDRHGMV